MSSFLFMSAGWPVGHCVSASWSARRDNHHHHCCRCRHHHFLFHCCTPPNRHRHLPHTRWQHAISQHRLAPGGARWPLTRQEAPRDPCSPQSPAHAGRCTNPGSDPRSDTGCSAAEPSSALIKRCAGIQQLRRRDAVRRGVGDGWPPSRLGTCQHCHQASGADSNPGPDQGTDASCPCPVGVPVA